MIAQTWTEQGQHQQTCQTGWGKPVSFQSYTKYYRQLSKTGSRKEGVSQGRRHKLII